MQTFLRLFQAKPPLAYVYYLTSHASRNAHSDAAACGIFAFAEDLSSHSFSCMSVSSYLGETLRFQSVPNVIDPNRFAMFGCIH